MTIAAVVSTGISVVSEIQSAKAQKKAIAAQFAQQQEEIAKANVAELNDRARQARREQARIKVAAGEAGLQLSGSVETLLADAGMQAALHAERTSLNTSSQLNASSAEANRMFGSIQQPTLVGAGLRLATAGVQGYASGTSMQNARKAAAKGPK